MGEDTMDVCASAVLDAAIADLRSIPDARLSENQRWHIGDAIESLRTAREEWCLRPHACHRCDTQCGDLSQP